MYPGCVRLKVIKCVSGRGTEDVFLEGLERLMESGMCVRGSSGTREGVHHS